ncbi:ABC1 family-domain-containing protein [Mycotypha africana]|uniref:ABC1 family-domain-containing protein n=1 Tax=Mycotypha africana TaxID=64632 RepID=UPI0022FFC762|nr:ABC1 family-domain-containing protein [Mycotypha africana]KAI8988375.1 ABC1 family-domain-containing protein [Mycotypha africana]
MSITRGLLDLYVLATSASKVGTCIVSSQTSAICHHVKTSSVFSPTTYKEHMENSEQVQRSPVPAIQKEINNNIDKPIITEKPTVDTSEPFNESSVSKAAVLPTPEPLSQNFASSEVIPATVPEDVPQKLKNEISDSSVKASKLNVISESKPIPIPALEQAATITENKDSVIEEQQRRVLKESRIPTSRFGRLWNYGTLATSMGMGALNESFKRATGFSQDSSGSVILSESNVNRLVEKLSRMRGAALKMGQMLSIQGIQATGDKTGLSPQLEQILLRVHDSANYMPRKQMEKIMSKELGSDWQSYFNDFDPVPIAAASIGQVHAAKLASTNEPVVIKIQYPGVAESIDSDLSNLKALVTFSNLLPRGLYLDNTIKVTKEELAWECDYVREANNAIRFRELLAGDERYKVPKVIKELCTPRILVSERLQGRVLSKALGETQEIRNQGLSFIEKLGERLLRLCLREVFTFRFMQTDPNWSNFFYNKSQIELLDFGACRQFPDKFVELYGCILAAAANNDREGVWRHSEELGFVTGYETEIMKNAHIDSVMVLGEPFRETAPDTFDFSNQTITQRIRETIPVMLRHRLTPPPDESYGLHKKLSGAFLLCTKLGSQFDTKTVWEEEVKRVLNNNSTL